MKNIEIKVSKTSRMVYLKKGNIGNDGENLQEKLVFSFQDKFVDGQARLEYKIDGEKYFAILTKVGESYELPIKNVITKEGQVNMQLVITEGTDENEIPVFKSNVFYVVVNESINAESEEPDGYAQWLDIANTKLNNIDEAVLGVQEAVDYAKEQGDYAKEQAENVIKANKEASEIIRDFEDDVEEYTSAFNQNVESKTTEFNTNATDKLNAYNTNSDTKVKEYNDNATSKVESFNENVETQTNTFNENATNKLNAYNTNAETKLNEFNTNADSYNERITANENDIVDINSLMDAIVPKNEASGVPIYVDDAVKYRVLNLDAKGNFKQETTTGKNLLAISEIETQTINGVTFTNLGDGTVKINGTSENEIRINIFYEKTLIANTEYKFVNFNLFHRPNANMIIKDNDGNTLINMSLNKNSQTYTPSSDTQLSSIRLYIDSQQTFTDYILKIMFIKSSDSEDWEPFTNGASPNPDFSQKIEVIEGDVSYRSVGKNLLPINEIETQSINGLTITNLRDGTIRIDGTATSTVRIDVPYTQKLTANTEYKYVNFNTRSSSGANVQIRDENNVLSNITLNNTSKTYTPSSDIEISTMRLYIDMSQTFTNYILKTMLIKSSENETFEPYKEPIVVPIDLKGNFVGKLPNGVADNLLYKDRHIYLEKNVRKVVLDGSIGGYNADNNWFYISFASLGITPKLLEYGKTFISDYFIDRDLRMDKTVNGISYNGTTHIIIRNADLTNANEYKTWLSENNVPVYYQLTTPELIDLGEYDLSTLEGTNNISLVANIEPSEMNITYAQNIKIYTDRTITQQIVGTLGGEY